MTTESTLASSARRALRAAAHHLDPVVMIGDKGLTSAVLHEIDIALAAHALIKVRVASDDREQRVAFMNDICAKLGCESVQHLGKLLVLWRNKEGEDGVLAEDAGEAAINAPASSARGPRKKLASANDPALRRPGENDPRPRESRSYGSRGEGARGEGGGYGRRDGAPPSGGYGAPPRAGYGAPPRSGYGNAPSPSGGGNYPPRGNSGYAPRGSGAPAGRGGYGRTTESGYNKPAEPGYRKPASGYGQGSDAGASDSRRFRRGGEAPAPDTRPPREGWAPRNRRGEGRNDGNAGRGDTGTWGARSRDDNTSGGAVDTRPPRGGGEGFSGARTRPAPSGDGRWGNRGGAGGGARGGAGGGARGGAAAPAAKPRARRRLG